MDGALGKFVGVVVLAGETVMNCDTPLISSATLLATAGVSVKFEKVSSTTGDATPTAPPGGLKTTERSKFAGVITLGEATMPKYCGHDNGSSGCTMRLVKALLSLRLTKPVGSRETAFGVTGLPGKRQAATACVTGL